MKSSCSSTKTPYFAAWAAAIIVIAMLSRVPARAADTTRQAGEAADAIRLLASAAARGEAPPATKLPDVAQQKAFDAWLDRNRASVEDLQPGPLDDLPWGVCTLRPGTAKSPWLLYLHVFDWHASGKIVVYGLAGGVRRAYLLASPDRAELPVSTQERWVVVSGPKEAPDPADTVVVLELDGEPRVTPTAVQAASDGTITLAARDVIVHGKTVRYEPDPHKNTVGYWADPADRVSWQFEVRDAGRYTVEILQGCGKGSGGSTVEFRAAGQTLAVTVQDTGGFQNFVARQIGELKFARPGTYTLEVKPTKKPGLAVMDLRQVTLRPAAAR